MKGCCPQLSFPICSQTSRASPPIVRYQSSEFLRSRMYLILSQGSASETRVAQKAPVLICPQ